MRVGGEGQRCGRCGDARGVLLAIVNGASGELGSQLWSGVTALVRRPLSLTQAGRVDATPMYALLCNPKCTGHMVYGRRRTTSRRRFHTVPQDQWIWSPEPHPFGDHQPAGLGCRLGHRRRARQQSRRPRPGAAPGCAPLLRVAVAVPVPRLQAPHARRPGPPPRRSPRLHLLRERVSQRMEQFGRL